MKADLKLEAALSWEAPEEVFIYHMKHFFHLKWQKFCHLQMEKENLEGSEKLGFFNIKSCFFLQFSPSKWHFYQKFGNIHANKWNSLKQIKIYWKLKNCCHLSKIIWHMNFSPFPMEKVCRTLISIWSTNARTHEKKTASLFMQNAWFQFEVQMCEHMKNISVTFHAEC